MVRQSLTVLALVVMPAVSSAARPHAARLHAVGPHAAGSAAFHNHLVKASPAIDGEVTQVPTRMVLWFSEPPEVKLSSIKLRSASDTTRVVATGQVAPGPDAKSIVAPISGSLTPGSYQVVYRTAGSDGHMVRGTYRFTLK